jgi:hypothetical protein
MPGASLPPSGTPALLAFRVGARGMNSVLLHILILWGVMGVVLGAIAALKRRGTEFQGLQYAGIFGFVGAAFGVVIGMTTFFASEHYAEVRQAAEHEATSLGNVVALSGAFPAREGHLLREQSFCYATDVIDREWSTTDGGGSPAVEGRERAAYVVLLKVGRDRPEPETWYSDALRAALDTGEQRQVRLLLSEPQIPVPLWILIYVGSAIIVLFAFFFHLENRRQLLGMLVAVTLMLTAVVGVLAGLDAPTEEPFGLDPIAMETERELIAEDVDTGGRTASEFCSSLPVPVAEPRTLD